MTARFFTSWLLALSILSLLFFDPSQTADVPSFHLQKSSPIDIKPLKVVTYNIHYGTNANNQLTLEDITSYLSSIQADIICLQEVDSFSFRGYLKDQPSILKSTLSMESAYVETDTMIPGTTGNLILSRYPIISTASLALPTNQYPRSAMKTIIATPYGDVSIINTHLGLSKTFRQKQLESLSTWIQEDQYPFIIAGDFNTSDSDEINLLPDFIDPAMVTDASEKNTFENTKYNARIDYILSSTDFTVTNYEVSQIKASDHYPVIVDMLLNAE